MEGSMPELPWDKWFPTNWASEPGLRLCSAATRGIWFEALNTMMLMGTHEISGTHEQLCALLCCQKSELEAAIEQLKQTKVSDLHEQNGNITFSSRRRERACQISEVRREAGKKSGVARNKTVASDEQGVRTPSSSLSASASASERDTAEIPSWKEFWEYCQSIHCGIAAEWYAKDKFWAAGQDKWKGKSDWRAYARRVRGWWDNDGRPMRPPQRNGAAKKPIQHLQDATHDASKDE